MKLSALWNELLLSSTCFYSSRSAAWFRAVDTEKVTQPIAGGPKTFRGSSSKLGLLIGSNHAATLLQAL